MDGYIHLKTRGRLDVKDLDEPVDAALELAKKHGFSKLLDDIREVEEGDVSLYVQTKSMGVLWKLRAFKKVAIVMDSSALKNLFLSAVGALHLGNDSEFRAFEDSTEALVWLNETN